MKPRKHNPIVANGPQRIKNSEEYRLKEEQIQAGVASKYQRELKYANLLQRAIIGLKMWREIRRELQKIAPNRGFYLKP